MNNLFAAGPGMGKTCSMAKLALDWDPGTKNNLIYKIEIATKR